MDRIRPFIAVLDDELQFCKALGRLLKTHGFEVEMFTHGEELLAVCGSRLPDCLLLDLHMPHINGFEVLDRLAALHLKVPVVIITGHDQPGNADRVRALGAVGYLLKPVNEQTVLDSIKFALDRKSRGDRANGNDRTDESMRTSESRSLIAVVADEVCIRNAMTRLRHAAGMDVETTGTGAGELTRLLRWWNEFQKDLTAARLSSALGLPA
jgi:FixJ family two-component response regulator